MSTTKRSSHCIGFIAQFLSHFQNLVTGFFADTRVIIECTRHCRGSGIQCLGDLVYGCLLFFQSLGCFRKQCKVTKEKLLFLRNGLLIFLFLIRYCIEQIDNLWLYNNDFIAIITIYGVVVEIKISVNDCAIRNKQINSVLSFK